MLYIRFYLALFVMLAVSVGGVETASAENGKGVTIAVFAKKIGGFEFKSTIQGDFSDLIASQKGAETLLVSSLQNVENNGVLNLQQDVLREVASGFLDVGINCSLTFLMAKGALKVGGLCHVLDSEAGDSKGVVAMVSVSQNPNTWVKLFEDANRGVAIYGVVSLP